MQMIIKKGKQKECLITCNDTTYKIRMAFIGLQFKNDKIKKVK